MIAAAELLYLLLTLLIPGGQAGAPSVAALLRHSAELYYSYPSLPVIDIIWHFLTQNKTTRVAMYQKDQFTIYNPQFTDRLEISDNGTKLRIKDLRMEDTGDYTTLVTFTNGETHSTTYVLTVYEPIPPPNVIKMKENTPDDCNVTLQCSVLSNTSDLSYTWKYRHQDSEYQLYNTGSVIQISLPPDHQDTEYLCIVQNPADQKNVSVREKFCFDTDRPRYWYFLLIPLFIVPIIVTLMFITWKKRRKHHTNVEEAEYCMQENLSIETPSSISQTLSYDQIPHRTKPPPQKFETLYTSVESRT